MRLQGSEGAEVLGFGSERWLAVTECVIRRHICPHISMKFSPAALTWIYVYL